MDLGDLFMRCGLVMIWSIFVFVLLLLNPVWPFWLQSACVLGWGFGSLLLFFIDPKNKGV